MELSTSCGCIAVRLGGAVRRWGGGGVPRAPGTRSFGVGKAISPVPVGQRARDVTYLSNPSLNIIIIFIYWGCLYVGQPV